MLLRRLRRIDAAPGKPSPPLHPHLVIGITDSQTCLNLTGRLCALREAGFRVTLISSPGPLLDELAACEGGSVLRLPMARGVSPLRDLLSFARLCRALRKLRPDIVEFSTPKAGLLGTLAARVCGVPIRVYMLRGLKLEGCRGMERRMLLVLERLTAAFAHAVLCNSESLRSEALRLRIAPREKLQLLGDGSSRGVHVEQFSPGPSDVRSRLGIPGDALLLGFVGRLTRDKGIPELIAAFDRILEKAPGAHLLLVGWYDASEDALDVRVRTRIADHPRIHAAGFVADTAPYYRAMDIMVLPTWREGFPNVVLEAAATAIPVITTECTGSRDSVIPEVTGLLIPPGYPEAICEAVLKLARDPTLRLRMGCAARAWVLKHFAHDRVLGLVTSYYLGLLHPVAETQSARDINGLAAASR